MHDEVRDLCDFGTCKLTHATFQPYVVRYNGNDVAIAAIQWLRSACGTVYLQARSCLKIEPDRQDQIARGQVTNKSTKLGPDFHVVLVQECPACITRNQNLRATLLSLSPRVAVLGIQVEFLVRMFDNRNANAVNLHPYGAKSNSP